MPNEEEFCNAVAKQELSYDAWGRLRNPATQVAYTPGSDPVLFIGRGYTGHEHMPWFGLVNMNARLYDATLGRFLAPDPYVKNPFLTQDYNRYTYAMNNPLVYIDQDGEFPWLIHGIVAAFTYLKAAHDNTPKADQGNPSKWNWAPWNWGKPEEIQIHIGGNTDGSGMHGGISAGKSGQPQPMVGYNKDKGPGIGYNYNGSSQMYHPGYDYNKAEKAGNKAIINANNMYHSMNVFANNLNNLWNSDMMRFFIADTYYVNLSGSLAFIGGGGADIGFALVTRGQNAGSAYITSTVKGKIGGHLGVGANTGRAMYTGSVQNYNFEDTFLGNSSGLEGDYIIGASISFSEKDIYEKSLILFDMGIGYGIGGSANIGAKTYGKKIFHFW